MNGKNSLVVAITLVVLTGILFTTTTTLPAHAGLPGTSTCPTSPGGVCQWTVSLDANNVCTVTSSSPTCTDTSIQTSFSSTHSVLIGAIVNASGSVAPTAPTCGTQCISGLYGWQFEIVYDNTSFVPQADPIAGTPGDFAAPTVIFGGQLNAGNPNWAGLRGSGAFGSSVILPVDATHEKIRVFLSILAPNQAVQVFPQITTTHSVTGNLLANVAFENLKTVNNAQFNITGVKFVDIGGAIILDSAGAPAVVAGSPITETVTDTPPVASFTATPLANGDTSCAGVTGANCSPYAYSFDGSLSTGNIANPSGYFWDFGDGSQDNINSVGSCILVTCNQGSVAIHDFGTSGVFDVTLRVVDAAGNTGSARDPLGKVLVNSQPSHSLLSLNIPPAIVKPTITASCDLTGTAGKAVSCTASATGGISPYIFSWAVTGGNPASGTGTTFTTTFATKGSYTVNATVLDSATPTPQNDTASIPVPITPQPLVVTVTCPTSGLTAGKAFTCSVSATGGTGPYTGTGPQSVTQPIKGSFTETFSVTDANHVTASGSVSVTIVAQPLTVTVTCPTTGVTAGKAFSCTVAASGGTAPYTGTGSQSVTQPSKGSFTESFTVMDSNQVSASGSATVTITAQPLTASFTSAPASPSVGTPVTFTAIANGGTTPYGFSWNFGDGTPAGLTNPVTHSYTSKGPKTVTLTVTDGNAQSKQASQTVTIQGTSLTVTVTCPTSGVTAGKPFSCDVSASGDTGPYTGTGTISRTEPAKGVKTENFSVSDANGVTATGSATVTVAPQPLSLTVSCPTSGLTIGKPFNCDVTATGGTAPYTGIGSQSATRPTKGTFTQSFTVTDGNGASATGSASVTITGQPLVVSVNCPANATLGVAFDCTVSAVGGTIPYTGTGTISITENSKGTKTESFTVSDGNEASASGSAIVNVQGTPLVVTVTCPSTATAGVAFDCSVSASGDTGPYQGTGTQSVTEPSKGVKTETFSVTDANGVTASGSAIVTVTGSPLVVTASCPLSGISAGKPFNCDVSATGGTAPYTGTGSISRTEPVKGSATESFTVTDANGVSASGTASVTVASQPLVVTVTCPTTATLGQTFTCHVSASGGTSPYTGTGDFQQTENSKGSKTESFSVTDLNAVTAAGAATVAVQGTPLVVTVTCPATATVGVSFDCTVEASGDTGPYTGIGTFSLTESSKGVKTETFSVTDANQVTASGSATVTVSGLPLVVTVTCLSTAQAGVAFSCTVTATGGTSPYQGTGTISITEPSKGSKTESFTVTDANGVSASGSTVVMITPTPVNASFTISPNPTTGSPVTFTASASGGTSPYAFNWDFGDGTTGTGNPVSHTYPGPQIVFNVTLTIFDANNATASSTQQIFLATTTPPVASFTETASTAPTGTTINFDASGSNSGGTITSYAWNFGDGNTGTGVTTSHSYSISGNYTVTLTIMDSNGKTATTTSIKVILDRPPTAAFTFAPTSPTVGATVSFDGSSSADPDGTIVAYFWNFGDSTTGSGAATTHVYDSAGTFNITLTVTDNNGQTGTASATITVQPASIAGAHASFFSWSVRSQFKKFSISRQGPDDSINAFGINDGNRTEWVYVQFKVTSDSGASQILYTQIVQLGPGQSINGNGDTRFSASFTPLTTGTYTVVATIHYSTASSKPPIGDASFTSNTTTASATFLVQE